MSTPSPSATQSIAAATQMGTVHLTVADLNRQFAFYQNVLGFRLHWQKDQTAGLGAGRGDLLQLTQREGVRPYRRTTGLYHVAYLIPTRKALAEILRSIAITKTPVQGMVNHHTHLAIYLPDAEGNGIELAWDFPRAQWPTMDEMMRRGNGPLDPDELFAELDPAELDPAQLDPTATWAGLDPATTVGHVHLHVADLEASRHFYHDVLGFNVTLESKQAGMTFIAAGDYHHHIGLNVWNGIGAPPPPADATGLRYMTVLLPTPAALDEVLARVNDAGLAAEVRADGTLIKDPAQNGVLLAVAPAS